MVISAIYIVKKNEQKAPKEEKKMKKKLDYDDQFLYSK